MPCLWILHNNLIGLNTSSLVTIIPDDTLVIQSLFVIYIPLQFGSSIDLPFIDINSAFSSSSMDQLIESSAENNSSAEDYDINFNHCNPEETNSPPKIGTQQWVALAWTLWEALAKQGMIKALYRTTGDNAANNVAMITIIQQQFAGIGIRWHKEEQFHRCACHVINLFGKEFLAHMGELTDEDYQFFDD
ncbi:hypothetical protein O181_026479 [Austropuccinia psidii MF-1]|uniref:Uncharacterized protein n=1 Tax=Austropuccinia psidii MF-1 TaxID=1389203 RepID=A0A9Q3CK18_9BASI|nr:hypothetical protein [Austropuccinia psidii MF-1]